MFLLNERKINIDGPMVIGDITYPNLRDPALREQLGIVEVDDPVYPDPELFYWSENSDGSLLIVPKTDEQINQQDKAKAAQIAQQYLNSTDYLFTVDKYASLTEERKTELTAKREEARVVIRSSQQLPTE